MTLENEKPYVPSHAELVIVSELQRRGAPIKVEFIEQEAFWFPGWTTRVIRFISEGGKVYEGESFRVLAWPQVSFVEMQALGMIKQ